MKLKKIVAGTFKIGGFVVAVPVMLGMEVVGHGIPFVGRPIAILGHKAAEGILHTSEKIGEAAGELAEDTVSAISRKLR
jgi:hypothetical protein